MAKGIGVMLVVLGHMSINKNAEQWIYSFHIPLFFILSGYVFSTKYSFKEFLLRKAKAIVIPYFVLSLVIFACMTPWNFVIGDFKVYQDPLYLLRDIVIQRRLWALWYLTVLFLVNLLFYPIAKFIKKQSHQALLVVFIFGIGLVYQYTIGFVLPWNAELTFMALPFFYTGYAYKINQEKIDDILTKIKPLSFVVLALVNIALCFVNLKLTGFTIDFFWGKWGIPPLSYISAVAGSFFVILLCQSINIPPVTYIGKNSLVYFAWHQNLVLPPLVIILDSIGLKTGISVGGDLLYFTLEFIITFAVLTVFNLIYLGIKKLIHKR